MRFTSLYPWNSTSQVELLMAPDFVGMFRASVDTARADYYSETCDDGESLLPGGYHEYFRRVYDDALAIQDDTDLSTPLSIRIVSGYGFGARRGWWLPETAKHGRALLSHATCFPTDSTRYQQF